MLACVTQVSNLHWVWELFLIIPVASVVHGDKEHTGADAVTSPQPLSVYTSVALIIIPLWASLWPEWSFLFCFIFPNTLHYGIQYFFGPSGAPWASFFKKYVYAVLLTPFLGCRFFSLWAHRILRMRPTAFLIVEKTGLWSQMCFDSSPNADTFWIDELQRATHSKIHLDHFKDA